MREIRPYGSEGGGAAALPTPILGGVGAPAHATCRAKPIFNFFTAHLCQGGIFSQLTSEADGRLCRKRPNALDGLRQNPLAVLVVEEIHLISNKGERFKRSEERRVGKECRL